MPKKRKGELPSGNIRRQVYDHSELQYNPDGSPMIDPKTGKQKKKRIYRSVTASTKIEADQKKLDIKQNKITLNVPATMTLREAISHYIDTSDSVLSPTTVRSYRAIMRYAFSDIMDLPLSKFTTDLLRTAVNTEAKRHLHKGVNEKTISAKTVNNEYGLISSVLNAYYPSLDARVKLPQKNVTKHELSSPDVIFNLVKGTEIELAVLLAMWLSFTLSEIKGLTKSKSLTQNGDYISIVQVTVTVGRNEITKDNAKQMHRHRTLKLPPYLKKLIQNVETDIIVPLSAYTVTSRFRKLVRDSGIPYMTFHDLRHVNASVMKLLNVPDKYAQERGGWKTDAVMKGTYMQTFSSARIRVDDEIDQYFERTLFPDQYTDDYYKNIFCEMCGRNGPDDIYQYLRDALGHNFIAALGNMQHEMQHEIEKTP